MRDLKKIILNMANHLLVLASAMFLTFLFSADLKALQTNLTDTNAISIFKFLETQFTAADPDGKQFELNTSCSNSGSDEEPFHSASIGDQAKRWQIDRLKRFGCTLEKFLIYFFDAATGLPIESWPNKGISWDWSSLTMILLPTSIRDVGNYCITIIEQQVRSSLFSFKFSVKLNTEFYKPRGVRRQLRATRRPPPPIPPTPCDCTGTTNAVVPFLSATALSSNLGGASQSLTISIQDTESLACGDPTGITFCGARQVVFYDSTGSVFVPSPANQLSWDPFTLTLTLTPTFAATLKIDAQVEFTTYPDVVISSSIQITVTTLPSATCLLPTNGMNLLNTDVIATQTGYWPGLNTVPNQACDGIYNPLSQRDIVHMANPTPPQYWAAQFPIQTMIKSVLVINRYPCCQDRIQTWKLQTGNDLNVPFTVCNFQTITDGGWWIALDNFCIGLYFKITNTQIINFYEISLYTYKAIQMNGISVQVSDGTFSQANALSNIVITDPSTLATKCQGPITPVLKNGKNASLFSIKFSDYVRVKGVVLTGIGGTTNPQTDVNVYVGSQICGVIADFSKYAEIDCANKVDKVVSLEKIDSSMQFCGFGILADCDCTTTYLKDFFQTSFAKKITVTSTFTQTIEVSQIVNQAPFTGIIQVDSGDIVTNSCGAGTCGLNQVIYSLLDGSPVPWPYYGLSLSIDTPAAGKDTLTITATDNLKGNYSILIRKSLIADPAVYLEATFTWEIFDTKCRNPIGSLNLLDVEAKTSQTNFVSGYDINSGVGCNKVLFPVAPDNSEIVAVNSPPNAWSVQLLNQVQIQTVLIVGNQASTFQDYALRFGSDPNPYLNKVCSDKMTNAGWWTCQSQMSGQYFSVTSATSRVEFSEVMIYNQQVIQIKAYLVAFSTTMVQNVAASAVSNVVSFDSGSCYASTTQTNPKFEFNLNAVTPISGVVALPSEDPLWTDYQKNVQVWVSDQLGEKQCGLFADYNTYSEVKCQNTLGYKVSLKKTGSTSLRLCGVGILADCDCSKTSFDPKLMPLYINKSPSEKSLLYTVNGSPQTITFTSNDTVSLVCGLADGLTYCGSRTVTVTNKLNGGILNFFQVTSTSITLHTQNEIDVGDYLVAVKIQLEKSPQAKHEFEVSVKILSAFPCDKSTLQLIDPALPLFYVVNKAHWIEDAQTLIVPQVIDSVSKQLKAKDACGKIQYTLYNAPDRAVTFDPENLNLVFQTKNNDGVVGGVHTFTVAASLIGQAAKPIIFTYTYEIVPCLTEVGPTNKDISVVIVAQALPQAVLLPGFVMTNKCGYTPLYYQVTGVTDIVSYFPTTSSYQLALQQQADLERKVDLIITPVYSVTVSPYITLIQSLTVHVQIQTKKIYAVKNQTISFELPPVWIESISTLGLTTILFRDELIVAENKRNITEQQINITYRLATDHIETYAQTWNWTFVNFTSKELIVQLNFTKPLKVSKYQLLDELKVQFIDPSFFISQVTKTAIMEPQYVVKHEIPKQFATLKQKQLAQAAVAIVEAAQYGTILGILIAQLAGKQVIKRIFSFFMMTQLVLMTEYFDGIMLPAVVEIVFKSIKDILNMESLPKDKIKAWIFNQVQGEPGSKFEISNSMSLVGIFLGIGGGFALVILVLYFMTKKIPKVQMILVKIKDALFFGTIIVSIQTAYLGVAYSGTLSIQGYALGKSSGTNLAVGILLLLAMIIYLIVIQATLTKLTKLQLEEPRRLVMYGALYKNLTLNAESLKWPGIFYARRLAVGVVSAAITNFTFQSHICMYLSVMVGGYVIGQRPISNSTDQRLEATNEVTLLVLYMVQIAFCGVVVGDQSDEVRVIFGWVFNGIYIGVLGVNLGFLLYNVVYLGIRAKLQKMAWFKKVKLMGKDPSEIIRNRIEAEKLEEQRRKAARREHDRQIRHFGEEQEYGAYEIPQDYENPTKKVTKANKRVTFSVSIHVPKESHQSQLRLEDVNKVREEVGITGRETEIKLDQYNRNAYYQLEEHKVRETLSEKKLKLKAFQEKLKKMSFDATREEEWDN